MEAPPIRWCLRQGSRTAFLELVVYEGVVADPLVMDVRLVVQQLSEEGGTFAAW